MRLNHAAKGRIRSRNLALGVECYKAARNAFENVMGIAQIRAPGAELLQEPANFLDHRRWLTQMRAMTFRIHDHEFTVLQRLVHVLSDA